MSEPRRFYLPKRLLPDLLEDDHWGGPILVLATVVLAVILYGIYGPVGVRHLVREGGPVENFTLAGYMVAILCLWFAPTDRRPFYVHSAFILGFLMAREADLHKALTTESIFKPSWYMDETVPLWERAAAGDVVIIMAITVIFYLKNNARRLWINIVRREPVAWTVSCVILAAGLSKLVDSGRRILKDWFGFERDALAWYRPISEPVEECLEAAIPVLVILAIIQWRRRLIDARYI
ncbi:MAG: hypothetical protein Alpg2KO_14730 [Alphaproteobacteria bacterium]